MINPVGIMQGRLSKPISGNIQIFPSSSWEREFEKASLIGFNSIEWIFDTVPNNPIMNKNEIQKIKTNSRNYDVKINSVCADYFMSKKLFNENKTQIQNNLAVLEKLIENCVDLDIPIIEIPLVDSSSLKTSNDKDDLIKNLEKILEKLENTEIVIALETDLEPNSFKSLLQKFDHPKLKANYDIGNSISNGYDPKIELELLKNWIINIHIKDRKLHGSTVPLGDGDVDFDIFFSMVNKICYSGEFIIQGAREDLHEQSINPEKTCEKYLNFVQYFLNKYS